MVYRSFTWLRAALSFAFIATLTSQNPASAQSGGQAGVAGAVRGDVTLVAAATRESRVVGEKMGSGDKIFLGDEISTGPDSGMQVMLLDETIFTIGPNSGLVIDEFVYDPQTNAGQVTASVVKGAFRFVSGRVAKEEPSKMNVKTPVGTIGIRGTSAAGVVTLPAPDDPNGTISGTFVLLGPGAGNNAGERAGRILISNGGTTVEISRSGFGTIVASPNVAPGTPVRLEPAQVAALTAALGTDGSARPQRNNTQGQQQGGQGGQGGGGGQNQGGFGQVTTLSGQNLGEGGLDADLVNDFSENQDGPDEEVPVAAQDPDSATIVNTAVATFDQLRSVQTGTATFNFGTISLQYAGGAHTDSGGSYNAQAFIDFGARTLDLQISNIQYFFDQDDSGNINASQINNGPSTHMFVFSPNDGDSFDNGSYENEDGFVAETWDSQVDTDNFSTPPTDGSRAVISAAILNDVDNGVVAAQGIVSMSISDANSDTVIAGGAVTDRQ